MSTALTYPGGASSVELSDPLSMPLEATLNMDDFMSAEYCGTCHEEHHRQWRTSMHAYAMVDPVFRALVRVRQQDFDGTQDRFCVQCHSAIGTRGGEMTPGFAFDELSDVTLEGVTCEACHKVAELQRPFNSGHVLDPGGPIRGTLGDPRDTPAHDSERSDLLESSRFCAGCHDVVEVSGMNLERAYGEWTESPSAASGDNCQTCHMPEFSGRATSDSPERDDLHFHGFVGVDVPLLDGFITDQQRESVRDRVRTLLDDSVEVSLSAPASIVAGAQLDLVITVHNQIQGHSFPTGSTSLRQAWLEVVVTDANDSVVYETGNLDQNGDLRDAFSEESPYGDADLITFHSRLVDALGMPVMYPWRAVEHFTRSIPPGHQRVFTLFVPTRQTSAGPLSVQARLRFRTHPPHLLRALDLDDLVERIEIYDIASDALFVEVAP